MSQHNDILTKQAQIELLRQALQTMVSQCRHYLEERPVPMSEMWSDQPTTLQKAEIALAVTALKKK